MPRVLNKRRDKIPPDAVLIDRTTKWGNPYKIGSSKFFLGMGDGTLSRQESIDRYEWRLRSTEIGATLMEQIGELRGKDVVCWCAPLPCHGDVLLELANR